MLWKTDKDFFKSRDKGELVETLHCDNPTAAAKSCTDLSILRKRKLWIFPGISEATIEKFIERGLLKDIP